MIPYEIERKFLINDFNPDALQRSTSKVHLVQGYTADGIRFTKKTDDAGIIEYKINHKIGFGLVRAEAQCKIDKTVFDSIWNLTIGRRVFKTRYHIPIDKYVLELDIYEHCRIHGLVIGEIEFASKDDAYATKLDFASIGTALDVTGVEMYTNIVLAC